MCMAALPPTGIGDAAPIFKTVLPNALHFRGGIQNIRVRDMEFQIPLPPHPENGSRPDFSIVQRAWWDVIKLVYAYAEGKGQDKDRDCPMRLTLELRIIGGSDILMAPQKGNHIDTASIEVLSIPDAVADDEWNGFCQRVAEM